jgi:hypothetical protein
LLGGDAGLRAGEILALAWGDYIPLTRRLGDALRAHRHLRGARDPGTDGHADIQTTQRCMHLSPASVNAAIQLLENANFR